MDLIVDEQGPSRAITLLQQFASKRFPGAALQLADLIADNYGSREEAERWYKTAIAEGDPSALNNFGCFLREDDARFADAEKMLMEAYRIGDPLAPGNLGRMYFDAGDPERAFPWFSKSIKLSVFTVLPMVARNLAALGREQEAREVIEEALSKDIPGAALAYAQILTDSAGKEPLEDPEKWFREALSEGARGATFPFACWLESQGRQEEAIPLYEASAREGEPNAHLNLAIIYERRDNLRLAEIHFQAGIAAGDATAAVTYAHFLADNGREDDLAEVLESARKMGGSKEELSEIRGLMDS
ncbi:hypothetical protein [Streptomyces sp. NPDC093105]|uniref:hypothetical protein n=1 Tax=Streptomyces sp. NPDC093105 TaxID=3366029 RepID=UPI003801BBAF